MSTVGANWRAVVQDNIRLSEETLRRIREQQLNYEAARKALAVSLEPPGKSITKHPICSAKFSAELEDKVNCLYSQVKNCMTELETERNLRCDGIRDVRQQITIHVGELKAMFQQLKKENEYVTETVKSLEKRFLSNASFVSSGCATSGMGIPSNIATTATAAAATSADLGKRVEELESTVMRQKRMMEDRQSLFDGVLREMVEVKIDTEMERMRSVARDAARESVEDVIRLRIAAMQEMFNDELQRVMRSTGVSSEVAQTTERLFREMEQDVMRRLQELNSALNVVSGGMRQHELALADMEGRVTQKAVAATRQKVDALRSEVLDAAARSGQASDAIKLSMGTTVTEAVEAACQEFTKKEEIAAAVAESECRMRQHCTAIYERFCSTKNTNDTVAAEQQKHAAELEKRLGGLQLVTEELQQQIVNVTKFVTEAKNEVEQWKVRVREALTTSKEARALAEESITCAHKAEDISREGVARSGVELHRLAQEQTVTAAQLRQLNEKMTTTEARHATISLAVNELSGRFSDTVPPLGAKLDSVHRTLHEVCMPKVEELMQSLRERQVLCEQLQTDVLLLIKTDARQAADIRRELRTGLQTVEDRVLQELHDWQQESNVLLSGLRATVDGLRATVKGQEKLFARKDALDMMESTIEEKLTLVEEKADAATLRAARKEQTTLAATPASVYTMASEVREDIDKQLEELRKRVESVKQNFTRHLCDVQKTLDRKLQDEVERLTQEFYGIREETFSQTQKLHKMVSGLEEDRSRYADETLNKDTAYLQTCIDGLRDAVEPKQLVSVICNDEKLLDQLTGALQRAFSLRTETTDSITRVQEKTHQLFLRFDELVAASETQRREIEKELKTYNLSQIGHAERLALLESRQETVAELNKRWCDDGFKDCKKNLDLFSLHFDECLGAIRSVTTGVELQTRTVQFRLQKLEEEQETLKKELAMLQAAHQSLTTVAKMHDMKKKKCKRNDSYDASTTDDSDKFGDDNHDDNNDSVWKARVEERVAALEAKTDDATECTADALDTLRGGLEKCVALFAQEAVSAELLNDSLVSDELTGLDGVLLFLLHQLCHLRDTVETLCAGAVETLDLVQHHEARLVLLQPLRSFALRCAENIGRVAGSLGLQLDVGVDPLLAAQSERPAGECGIVVGPAAPRSFCV